MSINYEVYGAPETWQNCFYAGGSTAAWTTLLNGEKAKVPKWNETHPDVTSYATSQLRYAVADSKIQERVPIDNSIAAIGQGLSSPFRKWFVYANIPDEEHPNGQIRNIGEAYVGSDFNDDTTAINTFWYEANNPTASAIYGNAAFSSGLLSLHVLERRTWSPDGENAEGTDRQNGNYYIAPFMSYGTRSFCLQILVFDAGEYNDEYTPGSAAPSGSWRTLDSWKNTYPTHAITAVWFRIRSLSAYNTSTGVMGYNAQNFGSSEYRKIGCGILDTIKFDLDEGTSVPELTDYALFNFSSNSELGVRLFTPHNDLYKWAENLQNIILYPTEISNYVKSKGTLIVPYVPYSDEFYEYVMRACACFGMPFTPAKSTGTDAASCQFNQTFTDENLCLPVIDDNGIANGDYTRGTGNSDNDFIDLADIRDKEYDPTKPPKNHYEDHTDLPTNMYTATNWYSDLTLGSTEPRMNLGSLFNSITELSDNPQNKDFLFQEPIKNILDYRRILLTQPWDRTVSSETIPLGAFVASGFVGFKNFQRYRRVTLGSFKFDREFENFLDFEPYTQAILYVPYCGIKQLPMNIFAGHTVNIYMNADNTSGVLQVLIFVDNIEWGTLSGMASEELPLVGETALTAANTKRELDYQQGQLEWGKMIGIGGSIAGASISAANKNPAGLVAQGASALFKNYYYNTQQAELQYQINHTKPEPLTIQKGDSSIDKMNVQYPFIMIQNPIIIGDDTFENIKQNYGRTKGFKCCETGVIGDFSGLTKCSSANLNGISCTYTEKKMIMEALQEGVIL